MFSTFVFFNSTSALHLAHARSLQIPVFSLLIIVSALLLKCSSLTCSLPITLSTLAVNALLGGLYLAIGLSAKHWLSLGKPEVLTRGKEDEEARRRIVRRLR